MTAPILIAYDGSENADHAIDAAGELLGGGPAEVLHAWEPVRVRAAVFAVAHDEGADLLAREEDRAREIAERGVTRAAAAGFAARGDARRAHGPAWQAIDARADELAPRMIVMGTRGLTGVRSALAGSVSRLVAAHAQAPVLTIPLPPDEGRIRP
ncbi:universal stress protein [Patulibacter sp. S7RM1-6]